jgi:hypothetical protein
MKTKTLVSALSLGSATGQRTYPLRWTLRRANKIVTALKISTVTVIVWQKYDKVTLFSSDTAAGGNGFHLDAARVKSSAASSEVGKQTRASSEVGQWAGNIILVRRIFAASMPKTVGNS